MTDGMDRIKIEICEDGLVKATTQGFVSDVNHTSAEGFLKLLAQQQAGAVEKVKNPEAHRHSHTHAHAHAKAGHGHE